MKPEARRMHTSDIAAANDRPVEAAERDRIERDRLERDRIERERVDREAIRQQPPTTAEETRAALFADEELSGYRTRWGAIQTGFVDEPRRAVEEADALVSQLVKRLTDTFAEERRQLEGQWDRSAGVSTEDLRLAMRRYRSFFERLLSI